MDLTSANSAFTLQVPGVFSAPQPVEGYATDDGFATPEVEIAQVVKGVDGKMSGAFVPFIITQTVTLQADSDSIDDTFEAWIAAMVSARATYFGSGFLVIPSIKKQYELINGLLTRITPAPAGKKILQAQTYQIMWDQYITSPIA